MKGASAFCLVISPLFRRSARETRKPSAPGGLLSVCARGRGSPSAACRSLPHGSPAASSRDLRAQCAPRVSPLPVKPSCVSESSVCQGKGRERRTIAELAFGRRRPGTQARPRRPAVSRPGQAHTPGLPLAGGGCRPRMRPGRAETSLLGPSGLPLAARSPPAGPVPPRAPPRCGEGARGARRAAVAGPCRSPLFQKILIPFTD